MSDADDAQTAEAYGQPPPPNHDLRTLDRLVGAWDVSGGAEGRVTYEWMEGGYFLLQRVDLGQGARGLEIIGHERTFGAEPSAEITSRFYSDSGDTLDYTYELVGNILTIWAGERGSPAYYRGAFSADGDSLSGGWVYPGGGGYESTSTRVR